MFCQCCFNRQPSAHAGHEGHGAKHFCRANLAYRINKGHHGAAHALLDGGKTAEVKRHRFPGMTNEPVVIHNLGYWGAPRNDGFGS